jgi:uncharacterized protein YrrD
MRLRKGDDVYSSQGEKLGTVERVVLDPETKEVTHLVVAKGLLFKTSKVIAMDMLDPAIEDKITLRNTKQAVEDFQDFEETHYVNIDQTENPRSDELPAGDQVPVSYWYPPINLAWWRAGGTDNPITYPGMPVYVARTEQNIPEGTVALEEGAKVMSSDDKHIGNIEQVIMDPQDKRVTHFVVSEGTLFKERKLIPVLWISRIGENEVHLSASADVLGRLPAYHAESST